MLESGPWGPALRITALWSLPLIPYTTQLLTSLDLLFFCVQCPETFVVIWHYYIGLNWLWDLQFTLFTDVPVHYSSYDIPCLLCQPEYCIMLLCSRLSQGYLRYCLMWYTFTSIILILPQLLLLYCPLLHPFLTMAGSTELLFSQYILSKSQPFHDNWSSPSSFTLSFCCLRLSQ